jgi:hypothetical protein
VERQRPYLPVEWVVGKKVVVEGGAPLYTPPARTQSGLSAHPKAVYLRKHSAGQFTFKSNDFLLRSSCKKAVHLEAAEPLGDSCGKAVP